jgi:hypothetical protein
LGVLLAHELLDAAVPASLLEAARREPAVVRAAQSFIGYVRDPSDDGPGFYQRWVVPLGVIATPGARLRYLAARALLPSADDHEFLRLPLALYPPCCPARGRPLADRRRDRLDAALFTERRYRGRSAAADSADLRARFLRTNS